MFRTVHQSARWKTIRWSLAALGLVATLAATVSGPLAARIRSQVEIVELQTIELDPVAPGDKGSTLTRGVGATPVITDRERQLLDEARTRMNEAKARQLGSTGPGLERPSPEEIDRQKLEILGAQAPVPVDERAGAPDAVRKGE